MKFLEIKYDFPSSSVKYIVIDGEKHSIGSVLSVKATDLGNGTYRVQSFSADRKDPSNVASELIPVEYTHTVCEGEVCSGMYTKIEWTYITGCYNSHYSYKATVVDETAIPHKHRDPIVMAHIHFAAAEYDKVEEILAPLLSSDEDVPYIVKRAAHKIEAKLNEYGLGREKNPEQAYIQYLYAMSYSDIVRFMDMGYGQGVLSEDYHTLDWDEYHTLLLLSDIGETDYAYQRMIHIADIWYYKDAEKNADRADYFHIHKYLAQSRLTACVWIMEREDAQYVENKKFIMFLGAYFSYLEQGHEGACSCEIDNGGGSFAYQKQPIIAERWIAKAIEAGNDLALRGQSFIDRVKNPA